VGRIVFAVPPWKRDGETHVTRRLGPLKAERLCDVGRVHGFKLSAADAEVFERFAADTVASLGRMGDLAEQDPPNSEYERDPLQEGAERGSAPADAADRTDRESRQPVAGEDPLGAFISKCEVGASEAGPLAGATIGLKDNVALAGVAMTCGWRGLAGYVPSFDATVATRLLEAGATVVGKLNMEALAFGGSGELSDFGPVRNPHDRAHLAGGSSGGCAAAVVADEVDVAIGTDAGGSIRRPAAWCGCVGLKPTFGLVPYTGIVSQAYSLDHPGLMARTVHECARVLDVIAGPDDVDPRGHGVRAGRPRDADGGTRAGAATYAAAATGAPPEEVSVVAVEEGFGTNRTPEGEAVDGAVRDALASFAAAGGTVSTESVPLHEDAEPIWTAINLHEMTRQHRADGAGHPTAAPVDDEWAAAYAEARRTGATDLPPTLELALVTGEYVSRASGRRTYREAKRLRRRLVDTYDRPLGDADVLAVPTVPDLPHAVRENLSKAELIERALGHLRNRAPFNATGHPVVSVPAGTVEGFPVGVSLVGRRGDDGTVLRAAAAFERTVRA
jgi:amidase